ncbi:hypothetical protein HK098_003597 [Nowakowskiella sp. JEL0407]|nr:hypothetical protein HK098_003597 [Nowakowskiella sp. JEL0407]
MPELEDLISEKIWSDVIPVAQDDGPNPLVPINYSPDYRTAMDLFRAVLRSKELSERAFGLTTFILDYNASHYTVWQYRGKLLFELNKDLKEELEFLSSMSEEHPKSYQIWHYRRLILEKLNDPSGERDFVNSMLREDSKNYHCWQYRQWLIPHFDLWDTELEDINILIQSDIRNNSAWNQRYFYYSNSGCTFGEAELDEEINYSLQKIAEDTENCSSFNYLRGIVEFGKKQLSDFSIITESLLNLLNDEKKPTSAHTLALLLDIYEERLESARSVNDEKLVNELIVIGTKTCEELEKHDPIRKNYWNWRLETFR